MRLSDFSANRRRKLRGAAVRSIVPTPSDAPAFAWRRGTIVPQPSAPTEKQSPRVVQHADLDLFLDKLGGVSRALRAIRVLIEILSVMEVATPTPSGSPRLDKLTKSLAPRQRQVLYRLKTGRPEKEIAAELGLSVHTAHGYVTAVYRRFGVNSRAELMALWLGE